MLRLLLLVSQRPSANYISWREILGAQTFAAAAVVSAVGERLLRSESLRWPWAKWWRQRQTVAVHQVLLDGMPLYVYTNIPQVLLMVPAAHGCFLLLVLLLLLVFHKSYLLSLILCMLQLSLVGLLSIPNAGSSFH